MNPTTRDGYLELLQKTYDDWGKTDGNTVFAVVKKWIESMESTQP